MAVKISVAAANAALNAIRDLLDAGSAAVIEIYTGTQPATPETAVTTQTLLARLTCSAVSAPNASAGVLTFNAITDGVGLADGTAAWCRISTQAGGTAILDGDVAVSGAFCNINTTAILTGMAVTCTSATLTHPVA